ncbi:MAG: hypothetical protein HPY60_00225 [Candidatus Methanofastidiosum sp.]|nr:hypothetical protein [Methanofastidiosum sp.]
MKKLTSLIISGLLLLSILIMVNPILGATHHIYPGDDIESIIEGAGAGDTIYIHAGTYYPLDNITINNDNITIIGDSPFNTIIDASSAGNGLEGGNARYITIKNITIRNAPQNRSGFDLYADNTLENCIAYNNGNIGFDIGDRGMAKNCLAYDNGGTGFNSIMEGTFINCTSAKNGYDGFYEQDTQANSINCIAYGNSNYGFSERVITDYCNAFDNTVGNYEDSMGLGSISSDPKFVTGRLGDYYLEYSSPCVDSGSAQSTALDLYNGLTTRTDEKWDKGTVDMGFHYASNRGPTGSIPIMKILEILKKNKN